MKAISVIMTACNAADNIAKSIESVLNQSFADFECIIVNNNSTCNTRSIINTYRTFVT